VPDLTFIPTEDLIAEVRKRAEAGVVILEFRREKGKADGEDLRQFDWWGGSSAAIGLAAMLHHDLLNGRLGAEDEDDPPVEF
jgi:hypothetical protein